jgi:hypothetical protein
MNENHAFWAYIATLGALVLVFIAALTFGAFNAGILGKVEAFGLGTITGGLIGVLRLPAARQPTSNVENADTVNQGPQS